MTTLPPPSDPDMSAGAPSPDAPAAGSAPAAPASAGAAPPPFAPPTPYAPVPPPWWTTPPKKKSLVGRILLALGAILFAGSVVTNIVLLGIIGLSSAEGGLEPSTYEEGSGRQVVAIYAVEGAIGDDQAAEFRRFYNQVVRDSDIRAVVLRVNSPGGSVSASDQIYHMIADIHTRNKPVVVSMGGVAASGGYYISAGAQRIVAEPTTITGSIGVISVWPVIKDFLNNHGVQVVTIRSRQSLGNKATENMWEIPDSRTRKNVEDMLTTIHDRFASIVRQGRPGLKTQTVTVDASDGKGGTTQIEETEPLNGKVYLGPEAKEIGLVDEIGYLQNAVDAAAKLAGLHHPKAVQYTKSHSLRALLGAEESASLLDPKALDKLMSPQILMLWKVD